MNVLLLKICLLEYFEVKGIVSANLQIVPEGREGREEEGEELEDLIKVNVPKY